MEETNVSLKLLIDRENQRVLYAEAGKDFIDFLFHILVLPAGSYIPLLKKQEMVGSFHNIYESIENLNSAYLKPNVKKESILNPIVHISDGTGGGVPRLLPNIESFTSTKFYRCSNTSQACYKYVAYDFSSICPSCQRAMSSDVSFVGLPSVTNMESSSEGGYVKGLVSYMVMDDLEVKPMSIVSSTITLLNRFNVKEIGALEEKVVNLGMDEVCNSFFAFWDFINSIFLQTKFSYKRNFELIADLSQYQLHVPLCFVMSTVNYLIIKGSLILAGTCMFCVSILI